jgi:nitrogen regulatory protein PII
MKMVVSYVEPEVVEPIRKELLELGFVSMSILQASGSVPELTLSAQYRGASVEHHLRPKARLECVVGDDHASTVKDTVLKLCEERGFVVILSVEEAFPTETVKLDAEAVVDA